MSKIIVAASAALASAAAFADFEIEIDPAAKPIRDVRQSTSGTLVGYAGCLVNEYIEGYWYGEYAAETSRAIREAGAWFQRMWQANAWFARRNAEKNRSYPDLLFPFWKRNDIKVLFTLEAWGGEKSKREIIEFVDYIVSNKYESVVAGFELGNETYFGDRSKMPALCKTWEEVIPEIKRRMPKVELGIPVAEYFELNPDLKQIRARCTDAKALEDKEYFSAKRGNQSSAAMILCLSNVMHQISHVIYHAYGAESPYSCSYYGFQRYRNFAAGFPEIKDKKLWLSEIRVRSDEDNRCQRMFRESLISAHYALMAICQPEMDGYNQHQMSNIHGGLYWSNGRVFQGQWRDDCGGDYADFRAPEGKPRLLVGHMGVMCRILTEAIKEHPLVMSHGTSKAHDVEDAFFTSARVCDQVYARRRALKEGKKPFLGLFGGVPEVEGEVEYVVLLNPHRNRVSIIMVNTKNEKVDFTFRAKGRELAAPAYVTMSCPEEFLDKCVIPGDGAAWRQLSWEDTQTGYYVVPMSVNDGLKLNCEALNLSIAPHTVQSVTFATRNAPKK